METILIHEPDAAILDILNTALQMEGYQVYRLENHDFNTLELIRRHRPKLLLLDCWLSNYAGKRLCGWIKAHFPRLPVIALSCDNDIDVHYHDFGFDGYLRKPFDLATLYQVIRKHLPRRQRQQRVTAGRPI
jgi:DNA-binding response OmpR family regulator